MIFPSEKELIGLREGFERAMISIDIFDSQVHAAFLKMYTPVVDDEGTPGYRAMSYNMGSGQNNLNSLFIGYCAGRGYNIHRAFSTKN